MIIMYYVGNITVFPTTFEFSVNTAEITSIAHHIGQLLRVLLITYS